MVQDRPEGQEICRTYALPVLNRGWSTDWWRGCHFAPVSPSGGTALSGRGVWLPVLIPANCVAVGNPCRRDKTD